MENEPLGGGESKKCGAKRRTFPFTACKNAAGMGTDHPGFGSCKFHAGSTPSGRASAHREMVEEGVQRLLNRHELTPVEDPLRQLQLLAAEVIAFKDILGDQVEQLRGWTYHDLTETEQVRAILMGYERSLDRCEKTLSGIVRLGIEERLARVTQAQAALMIRIVEAVLDSRELNLPSEQRRLGRTILAREVEAVVARPPALNGAPAPA